jgi:hypothetical protein
MKPEQSQVDVEGDAIFKNVKKVKMLRRGRIRHASTLYCFPHLLQPPGKAAFALPTEYALAEASSFTLSVTHDCVSYKRIKRVDEIQGLIAAKGRRLATLQATVRKRLRDAHDKEMCATPLPSRHELKMKRAHSQKHVTKTERTWTASFQESTWCSGEAKRKEAMQLELRRLQEASLETLASWRGRLLMRVPSRLTIDQIAATAHQVLYSRCSVSTEHGKHSQDDGGCSCTTCS